MYLMSYIINNNSSVSYDEKISLGKNNLDGKTEAKGSHSTLSSSLCAIRNKAIHAFQGVKSAIPQALKQIFSRLKTVRNAENPNTSANQHEGAGEGLTRQGIVDNFNVKIKPFFNVLEKNLQENKTSHSYCEQAKDAMLASFYTDAKMQFELINKVKPPYEFLKAIGDIAYNNGTQCNIYMDSTLNKARHVPKGAGANPFLASVLTGIQKECPKLLQDPDTMKIIKKEIVTMIENNLSDYIDPNSLQKVANKMMAEVEHHKLQAPAAGANTSDA